MDADGEFEGGAMTPQKQTSTSHPLNPECAEFMGITHTQMESIIKTQERIASIVFGDGASDGMLQLLRSVGDKLDTIDKRHLQEDCDRRTREMEGRKFKWDSLLAIIAAVLSVATGIMVYVISMQLAPLLGHVH
jgi:hypothetical protein